MHITWKLLLNCAYRKGNFMGYIAILSLIPLFIEIGRIKDFFYYKKGKRPDPPELMSKYPIFCIAAIIIAVQTLSTNYIFLNFLNIYRIQSYPESTIFCHVSLYNDVDEVIYPCEVIKDKDEDGTYYFLKKIFIPNSELDLSDEDIQLYTDEYTTHSIDIDDDYYFETRMKLINIKYKPTKDISKNDEIMEYINIVLALIDIIYVIDCICVLINSDKKLKKYDEYFKSRFGYLHNEKTNEVITDTRSYIDALKANDEIQAQSNN